MNRFAITVGRGHGESRRTILGQPPQAPTDSLSRFLSDPLTASLILASMLHIVALLALVTLARGARDADSFFSVRTDVRVTRVSRVQVEAPPVRPQARPASPPKPGVALIKRAAQPAPAAPTVSRSAPAGGPAPAPRAPVARPVAPNPAPAVIASRTGSGPPVQVGNGGGDPRGVPGGTGRGGNGPDGSGGRGNGPGPGGQGTGPGGPTGYRPDGNFRTPPEWNNCVKLGIGNRFGDMNIQERIAQCHTWEEVLTLLGLDRNEVYRRPFVEPCFLMMRSPEADLKRILGDRKPIRVQVHCILSATGVPRPSIVPTGDRAVDSVAYSVALLTTWLPALREGKPVEYEFDYCMLITNQPK